MIERLQNSVIVGGEVLSVDEAQARVRDLKSRVATEESKDRRIDMLFEVAEICQVVIEITSNPETDDEDRTTAQYVGG